MLFDLSDVMLSLVKGVIRLPCIVAPLEAAGVSGVSGVAGGSLLLVPMATSLFGISTDVAMQVVTIDRQTPAAPA